MGSSVGGPNQKEYFLNIILRLHASNNDIIAVEEYINLAVGSWQIFFNIHMLHLICNIFQVLISGPRISEISTLCNA